MSWTHKKIKAASERGKRMAAARWKIDAERRDRLAELDPIKFTGKIVRRVIVIDAETTVKEAVIFDFDSFRSALRKTRSILKA
jgi:hypothetical protein